MHYIKKPNQDIPHALKSPLFYMVLAMAMWAIIENIPQFFSQHYTSYEIVWLRYSIHLIFMIVVFGPRVKSNLVRTQRLGLQLFRGLLMMGMHLSFIFAVKTISFHATMAGFWVAPLLLLALSFWQGERASRIYMVATFVAYLAVLVISRPVSDLFHPSILLALIMAACFAVYMQISRSMQGESLLASLFYTAFSVWVVLSFLMPFYWVTPTGWDLILFAAIGLLGYVCIYGFDKAAELAPTWVSAPFAMIQPVLILLSGWFVRSIFPGRLSLAMGGLIFLILGYLAWRNDQPPASLGS